LLFWSLRSRRLRGAVESTFDLGTEAIETGGAMMQDSARSSGYGELWRETLANPIVNIACFFFVPLALGAVWAWLQDFSVMNILMYLFLLPPGALMCHKKVPSSIKIAARSVLLGAFVSVPVGGLIIVALIFTAGGC
jgi:hypothetical protein